jgi:hypothetical protein
VPPVDRPHSHSLAILTGARVLIRCHDPEGMSKSGAGIPAPGFPQAGGSLLFAAPGTPAGIEH